MGKRFRKTLPNILQGKTRDKEPHGKKFLEKPKKKLALTETKNIYYEQSLGGIPGGERVPVVEGGKKKRVAIRIVGVFIQNPSWNSTIVCTREREGHACYSRGRMQS